MLTQLLLGSQIHPISAYKNPIMIKPGTRAPCFDSFEKSGWWHLKTPIQRELRLFLTHQFNFVKILRSFPEYIAYENSYFDA